VTATAERRFLLVGNPTSQSGKAAAYIDEALDSMRSRCWYVDFMPTLPDGLTVAAVAARLTEGEYDTVVALGGDGTFAEVATGLLAANRPEIAFAFLPFGTANDQGRSFGLHLGPTSLPWNLDIIEARHVRLIDYGDLTHLNEDGEIIATSLVFHSVGWGMQPDILAVRNREREVIETIPLVRLFYRNYAVYAGAVLDRWIASWVEPTKFDARLLVDGERMELTGLTDLVVNATSVYGGMFVLDRFAEPDDGRFEVFPIFGRRDWAISALRSLRQVVVVESQLSVLPKAQDSSRQVSSLEVHLVRPGRENVRAQVDGEEWHSGAHFKLQVHKQALPMLVPAEFVPAWQSGPLDLDSE